MACIKLQILHESQYSITLAVTGERMDLKIFVTVFITIFIAEIGDKTQLATLLFAADREVSKLTVFAGASLALIVAAGIGVLAGGLISNYISEKVLNYLAGAGFIAIGLWTILRA
jgi:putative Ca2+/H+ antiporter (TMEM165/GDT1 family)